MIDLTSYVDHLCKNNLTQTEFLICMLVEERAVAQTIKYTEKFGLFQPETIDRLVEKGYLMLSPRAEKMFRLGKTEFFEERYTLDNYLTTSKFSDGFLVNIDDAYEELKAKFPPYVEVKGIKYSTVGLSFADEKEARQSYKKAIKNSLKLHKEVLKWLDNYVAAKPLEKRLLFPTKIDKFISARIWLLEKDPVAFVNNNGAVTETTIGMSFREV